MSPTVTFVEAGDLGAQDTPQTSDRTVHGRRVRPVAGRMSRPSGATAQPLGVLDPRRLAAAPARGVRT